VESDSKRRDSLQDGEEEKRWPAAGAEMAREKWI
jgi:hypothetical protein